MEVDVSVCVGIYNAGIKELLLTTFSIVKQKKVSFEIIFADDGSENDYSAVIDAFFLYWPQVTYRYERSNVNRGTVNNFYSALRYARGKYVKLISPGDFFSYENALFDLVNVLKVQNMEACFSDAICYRKGVDSFTLSLLDQPKAFRVYEKNNKYLQKIHYLVLNDKACGATCFCERQTIMQYLYEIIEKVKYSEDSLYRLAVLDGIGLYHFKMNSIYYELGTGVSTSKSQKWRELLYLDDSATDKILIEKCKGKKGRFYRRYALYLKKTKPGKRINNNMYKLLFFPESFVLYLFGRIARKNRIKMEVSEFAKECIDYSEEYLNKMGAL